MNSPEYGVTLIDFRGQTWTFVKWERMPEVGFRSGKVVVKDEFGRERTFYHNVFPELEKEWKQ